MKKALLSLALLLGMTAVPAVATASSAAAYSAPYAEETFRFVGNPADGSTVKGPIESFTLEFTGTVGVTMKLTTDIGRLDGAEYNFSRMIPSGNKLTVYTDRNKVITSGTLVVPFPEGSLTIGGVDCPEFTYTFTVDPKSGEVTGPAFEPVSGSAVSNLKTITLTNSGILGMSDADLTATLTNTTTGTSYTCNFPNLDDETGNVEFTFGGKDGVSVAGNYKLVIPAGMFWVGSWGETTEGNSPEYTAEYIIAETPTETVDFASVITNVYPNDEEGFTPSEYWAGAVTTALTVKGSVAMNALNVLPITMTLDGSSYASVPANSQSNVNLDEDAGVTDIMILFQMLDGDAPAGTYEMTIPAGYFTVGGKALGEYKAKWVIKASASPYSFSWTPAAGSTIDLTKTGTNGVSNAGGFQTIRCSMGTLERAETSVIGTITNEKNEVVASFDTSDWSSVKVNSGDYVFRIQTEQFPNGINVNGVYTFHLPEGFFLNGTLPTAACEYSWTLTGGIDPNAEQIYTLSPEPGSYDVYPTITLTYENCTKIAVAEGATATLTLSRQNIGTFNITTDGVKTVTLTPTTVIKNQPPSEYSVYNLNIPAGSYDLTINNVTAPNIEINLENTYKVNVPTPDPLTLTPANGAYVKSVEELQYIYYATDQAASFNVAKKARLYKVVDGVREATPVATYNRTGYPAEEGVAGQKGEFSMIYESELPALENGVYELVLPAELYRVVLEGSARQSKEQVARYTLDPNATAPVTVTTNPAEGATVKIDEINDIIVTFDGASSVEVSAPCTVEGNGKTVSLNAVVAGNTATYMFILDKPEAGEWTVTVPANSVKVDGKEYAQEIKWSFNVEAEPVIEVPAPTVTPATGEVTVDQLRNVTLTYAEGTELVLAEEGSYYITLTKSGDMMFNAYEVAVEGNKVVLTLPESVELTEGIYTLTVYANSWTVNGTPVQLLTYEYNAKTGGICIVGMDADAQVNVFSIDGVCVMRNADASDLNLLPAGLYIVNGKKVMIRK